MGVKVVQLTSNTHHENILASLHQLRLQGHLSDVTVQVDYQGDVQEFQAHQVMLAASSGYFKKILLSQDAARDKLLLSNMHSRDFSKFLEFVYTGKVKVARDRISDVQAVAKLLDCEDLSEVCVEAMSAGILQRPAKKRSVSKVVATDDLHEAKAKNQTKRKKQPKRLLLKRQLPPQSCEKEVASKRLKAKDTVTNEKRLGRQLKLRIAGNKVLQRRWYNKKQTSSNEDANEESKEDEDRTEAEAQSEDKEDRGDEPLERKPVSDVDDFECEDDEQCRDPEETSLEGEEEEEEEEDEDGQSNAAVKRTSKAQFQCNKCQRTFHYERSYLKHISTYHGVKADVVFRCETCQQTFANRSNLKIHEKHVHSNERLFACESCTKTFKRKKDVVRHQRQVHERNLRHVCSECGKALSSKTALLLHERTHTGTKPFECTDCGAKFTQNSALKMHRRTHTGEKPFACDECDSRFTQKHMLAYHKRSHTGEKPFMCEACGKSFASKEYLRHHSNIHTGSKPYKCEQCGRGFAQRNSLNQHLKIHTGERPYSCKDCDKQFTQLNALQRHQRIHTGEKPYMCGLCKRTFTDKSTLRRHTMVHDSDAPWKTYLVVLEGNVEEKKPKSPTNRKTEKAGTGEKQSAARKSSAASGAAGKTQTDSIVVPAEPVTLPSDWTSHGAIALVSHGALGGITVIHTEVPPGTQIQPIVATDGTGASIISLDGPTIPVPFSLPVSMAHGLPLTDAASTSLSVSSLSVPVSDSLLASVSEIPTVSTSSVLEAAASQTILAPVSDAKAISETETLHPNIQTVIVTDGPEQPAADQSNGQQKLADSNP
ncbi:GDNF-inducible zinc finger protein 1 [Acanthochromis polyacanthus]|uniref:GDNF-inducible zinc finger protein 1 n=1 Tax=Acanthochromis polyacanthus TaxID=80966 RepID=UPI000B8F367F|nr:GDNF-inducible zinc finger protein 1 [Acanthochromis polyacanthus]